MKFIKYIVFLLTISASAQQVPQYSQYIWNSYLINPAIGGAENFLEWKAGYRNQWIGVEGAPQTMYFTVNGQVGKKFMNREDQDVINRGRLSGKTSKFASALGFKKRKFPTAPTNYKIKAHHGVGAQVMNDQIGPFNTLGIYGSYAYHIPLSKNIYLSMGAFLGIKQYKIDINKITTTIASDNAIGAGMQGMAPDGMLGVMLYGNRFFVGGSMSQIFYNTFKIKNEYGRYFGESTLVGHYFLMGGYRFKLSNNTALVPSTIIRYLPHTRPSIDLTLKLNYLDIIWTGASLRNGDAIIFLAGFSIKNKIQVGYSYDYTTSALGPFSKGTHEIIIGFKLINRNLSTCRPSHVW